MKRLYSEFNNLNIDTDLQPMEVSEFEKEKVKRTVMRAKRKNHLPRNLSVAVVFLVASSITLSVAFPTFAAKLPIVGNVFELFNDDEKYVFEEHDTYATDIGVTKESNGVSVTVTDAVYDGENITIAYTMESEKDLGQRPVLDGKLDANEFQDIYKDSGYSPNYITKKVSDNEYAGLFIYQLIEGPKPDEIHVTWDGDNVVNLVDADNPLPGDWSFQLTLQALEGKTKELSETGIHSKENGIDVALTKMTETPVSTTLYLSEQVDVRKAAMENVEWRGVVIDYLVTDDLGNEYNAIHYKDTGHSTDFKQDHVSDPRITTTVFNKEATSVTITPIVNIYKMVNDDGTLESVKEPYPIEPMQFDLN
ncbi:DUF4179 domain-containing protein [Filibacter tadaridae]|uniref:DUF4179 domain-containing protein n=1 Tax=Filibacter tadaridae TaxID=2483811 RepID=A0A3P5X9Q2_9BACL|nr:DUF4179 domain-containing protein [Filibacter tadaridae]VDC24164.1 hypothetical protein FILTAD_01008 [Filibacter tadaridae]